MQVSSAGRGNFRFVLKIHSFRCFYHIQVDPRVLSEISTRCCTWYMVCARVAFLLFKTKNITLPTFLGLKKGS